MPGGYKNINGKDGKLFSSDYQPVNNGRKASFKTQFARLLKEDSNGTKEYLQEDVEFFIDKDEDGNEIEKVRVKMGTLEAIAMNVLDIAMKGRPKDVIDAAKFISSQIEDNIPLVAIQNNIQVNNFDISKLNVTQKEQLYELLELCGIKRTA